MIKYLYILFLFISPILNSQVSQNPLNVEWGKEFKVTSGSYLYKIVNSGKNGVTALRLKKGGLVNTSQKIIFERYGATYDLEKAKEISLKYKNKSMDFEESFTLGGKLYLFSSFANQRDSRRYLFAQEIKQPSLTPEKKLTYIDEMPFSLLNETYIYSFSVSPDSSHLLVYHPIPGKKDEPAKYSVAVFDENLNKVWTTEYKLLGKLNRHIIENAKIDNNGNAFLLLSTTLDKKLDQPEDEKFKLIALKNKGTIIDEFDINLKGLFINGLNFKTIKYNTLVCAGFYSNRGVNSIKGVFYYTIDIDSKQVINQSTKDFEFDFIAGNLSESRRNKLKASTRNTSIPELPKFNLDQLILRGDGGALLLAEQYDVSVYSDYDYFTNRVTNRYIYQYDDIVAVSVSPEGNIDWATRIPKRQETMDDQGVYSSYCYGVTGDQLIILYNDNPKNYFKDKKSSTIYEFDAYRGQPSYSIIESNGAFSSGILENTADDRFFIRPSVCKQVGSNRILVYKEFSGRYKWGVVSLK